MIQIQLELIFNNCLLHFKSREFKWKNIAVGQKKRFFCGTCRSSCGETRSTCDKMLKIVSRDLNVLNGLFSFCNEINLDKSTRNMLFQVVKLSNHLLYRRLNKLEKKTL